MNLAATYLAGYLKIREVVPSIIAALPRMGYDWVDGLEAILSIGGPDAHEYLIDYIENGNRWRLEQILMMLVSRMDSIPIDTLIGIVNDEKERLNDRVYAAYAAVAQGNPRCRQFLLDQFVSLSKSDRDQLLLNIAARRDEVLGLIRLWEPEEGNFESEKVRQWREEMASSFWEDLAELDSLACDLRAKAVP